MATQPVQHTPGPWIYIDATKEASMQFASVCIIRGAGKQIASFSWQTPSRAFPSKEESQANARLIAAAPQMLEALELVWSTYGFDPSIDSSIWQTVQAAIAKATGAA